MEKINLCLASPSFFPTYGGAQLRFLRYLPGFRARAIDTHIVTGTPLPNEHTESHHVEQWLGEDVGTILESETPDGTPVHRVRLPDEKGWRRDILFNRTVLKFCGQPNFRANVVQFVTALRPVAIPWIRRLHAQGIAVTYAVTIAPKSSLSKRRKGGLRNWTDRLLYNQLDRIITNNTPLQDFVGGLGVSTPIEVIPNGVDLRRFHPPLDETDRHGIRERLGLSESDFLVTTIGAVRPRKGSDLLLEAWLRIVDQFPSAHLLFVGPRTDLQDPRLGEFRNRLVALTKASGAPGNIHFVGEVYDVEEYLRASDVFVLPSYREGMPNSVLEAMASGLPVVITPFIGLSDDLGQPGRQFLLSPHNARDLSAAIVSVLANPEKCAALADSGYRWVKSRMDLDLALDRYAAVYREIAAR